jgi:hypothetical protein
MKRRAALVAVAVVSLASRVAAEPLHFKTPSSVVTDGGSSLRLPPGYFLEEPAWAELDVELKAQQERVTRLEAENASLRTTAAEWQPGWKLLVTAFAMGAVASTYAFLKLN